MKYMLFIFCVLVVLPIKVMANDVIINAARNGDVEVVKTYLKTGGDVNALNPYGGSAIMFAARAGNTDVVKLLISAGADLNIQGRSAGTSALIWAAQYESLDIVKLLIEAGADINLVNHKGNNALYFAIENGNKEIEKLLRSAGAK